MNNAALARTRVYQDAANDPRTGFRPDEQGAKEIFIRLDSEGILARMADPAANDDASVRRDAQTGIAASRLLEQVIVGRYEEPMPDLKMAEGGVIDINRDIQPGAKTFTYFLWSGRGMARFSSSWSGGNAIMTTVSGAEKSGRCQGMEAGYAYTMADMRHAGFMNLPLDTRLAKYDRRAHARLLHDTGLWGREDLQLPGLVKHPNINAVRAPLNGGSTSRTWALKSVSEILADIATLVNTAGQATDGMRRTTHVFLPRAQYDLINGLLLSTGGVPTTVLSWIQTIYKGVTFEVLDDLAAAKSIDQWGTQNLASDAALAIVKDKDLVSLVVPMDYTSYPPQYVDLKVKVPTESMTGGVMLVEPFTITRMDGI